MKADLRELYQEVILDHSKHPHNFGPLAEASGKSSGFNPLCGDEATIYVRVEDDVVKEVRFEGKGCSISTASASMMTDAVKGKTLAQVEQLFERFHALITASPDTAADNASPELGKLAAFSGVCEFPVRVKCASLPWHTLRTALEGKDEPVTTE
jgi:nitrogen fixation NifU-like protein